MVEVFKTNVQEVNEANKLMALLREHFPESKINFDLDDCDRVLRIDGQNFINGKVMLLLRENGFNCQELE